MKFICILLKKILRLHVTCKEQLFNAIIKRIIKNILLIILYKISLFYLHFIIAVSKLPHNAQPTARNYAGMVNKSVRAKLTRSVPTSRRIMNRYERPCRSTIRYTIISRTSYIKWRENTTFSVVCAKCSRSVRSTFSSYFSFMMFALRHFFNDAVNDKHTCALYLK